jgi:hypothetical protein
MSAPTASEGRSAPEPAMSIETAERSGHGPLAADPSRGDYRGYVVAFLVCALGLVGCVGGINTVVDPYGTMGTNLVPTAIESDRAAKITLLEQLKRPPGILILGSSRSRPAAPRYLQKLTGHTGFNAGVTSGDSVDEWVFTRLMEHRFPGVPRRYLIFINVGIGAAAVNPQLAADPRAQPYLTAAQRSGGGESLLHKISDYLSVQATRDSWRVVHACVIRSCSRRWFHADGSLLESRLRTTAARTSHLQKTLQRKLAAVRSRPVPSRPTGASGLRAFTRLIGWMNAHGATPVVVMNPLHPALLRALDKRGFPRHAWAVSYLHQLRHTYRFDFIDLTDVRTFHGLPNGFFDPTHVSVQNMRLMLRYIAGHDHGIL